MRKRFRVRAISRKKETHRKKGCKRKRELEKDEGKSDRHRGKKV